MKLAPEILVGVMSSLKEAVIRVLVATLTAPGTGTVATTVGRVASPVAPVMKLNTKLLANARPVTSVAAVVTVATHSVLAGSGALGVKVAVWDVASYATPAAMGEPAGQARVKLAGVRVAPAIGLLKVTNTRLLVGTPVAGGVLATGKVADTVGAMPARGAPRIGSRPPPPHPATRATRNTARNPAGVEKWLKNCFIVSFGWVTIQ